MVSLRALSALKGWRYRPKMPGLEEFLAELGALGLKGVEFDAYAYARALERRLGYAIDVREAGDLTGRGDLAHRVLSSRMGQAGAMGLTLYSSNVDPPRFLVLLADGLNSWLYQHTVFHELAHIAAGHPFRNRLTPTGRCRGNNACIHDEAHARNGPEDGVLYPPRRLALRRPFVNEGVCEEEADLRAGYAMLAGNLGRISLQKDNLNQAG